MNTLTSALHINPALWLLLKMNSKGALRKFARNLLTWHGALVGIVLFSCIYVFATDKDPLFADLRGALSHFGGIVLALMFFTSLEMGLSRRTIYFTNAEVQFVLNSPVTRQEVLTYHLIKQLSVTIVLSAFLAFIFGQDAFSRIYFVTFFGSLAYTSFPYAVASAAQWISPELTKRFRRFALAATYSLVAVFIYAIFIPGFGNGKKAVLAFLNAATLRTILFPFYWTNEFFFQGGGSGTLLWGAMLGGLSVYFLWFASKHLEFDSDRSSEAREKITEKVEKLKKHGITLRRIRLFEWNLPQLPYMGGVGPILWRRWQELSRYFPYLLALLIFGVGYHYLIAYVATHSALSHGKPSVSFRHLNDLSQITVIMTAFIITALDFRADTHRLEWLKSLPIRSSRLVLGQIAISSLFLAGFMSLLFLINYRFLVQSHPQGQFSSAYFGRLAFSLPLGVLYASVANTLFLLIPIYGADRRAVVGVFQSFCGIVLCLGVFALYSLVIDICGGLTQPSANTAWPYFALLTLSFSLLAALAVRVVVWAYDRFDISRVSR